MAQYKIVHPLTGWKTQFHINEEQLKMAAHGDRFEQEMLAERFMVVLHKRKQITRQKTQIPQDVKYADLVFIPLAPRWAYTPSREPRKEQIAEASKDFLAKFEEAKAAKELRRDRDSKLMHHCGLENCEYCDAEQFEYCPRNNEVDSYLDFN
ncbi:MAG: hypothetical protein Q4A27_01200 [bacterium]|nr:hypothetical protein [bacterium]